ncbi:MAG: PAS domain-containing protein [Bacteroidota bacterium]
MSAKTRILIVEHDLADIELLEYELKKGGINFVSEIVQNERDYVNALTRFIPDIILSDYSLPSFDGPTAFKIREQMAPDIPFIFVSGNIGEENSIEYIRNGLTDYALKDKLFTLATKVKRALRESKEQQQKNKTEQERILSERRLVRAQQVAHMGSWELNFETNDVLLSDEACRIYGLAPDKNQQVFETWLSFIHPEDLDLASQKIKEAKDSLLDFSFDYRIVDKHGVIKHIYSEGKIELDSGNKPTGLYGIVHDVTEKKLADENLRKSESSLKEAQAIAQVGNWEINMVTNIHYWSDEVYKIFGINTGEVIPCEESFMAFFHPDDLKYSYELIHEGFKTFTNIFFDFRFIRKDGEVRYGYNEWKFKFDKNGNPQALLGIFQDITERKHAETERIKMVNDLMLRNKDLEQFTYIISHNLRAPVANIIGIADTIHSMQLDLEKEKAMKGYLITSVKKLDEVIKDLNQILQVKRDVNEKKEIVRFSELLADIQLSIDSLIRKEDVQFITNFIDVDEINTLKSYLYSIFFNLISNSIKYRSPHTRPLIEISSKKSATTTELIFKDNGLGIDLKKRGEQVFGLYKRFHTHTEGKGMGLYMVKAQVETLGGKISIQSEIDKGTEFKIEFDDEWRAA